MVNPVLTYSHALTKIFNDYVKSGNFPDILKYADIKWLQQDLNPQPPSS